MDLPNGTGLWIDRDLRHNVPPGDRFILHLDIKDDNSKHTTLRDALY